jgi:hypothetical protein
VNDNKVGEIRRAVVRERDPGVLRRWVLELLEDRTELRKEADELRARLPPPARPLTIGISDDTPGRG